MSHFEYNAQGLVSRAIDPRNQATQFAYDLTDLVGVTNPLSRTVRVFTDPLCRVTARPRSPTRWAARSRTPTPRHPQLTTKRRRPCRDSE